ncbi:hypothetical protein HUJ05_002329 [Dendroctonus ponderosae]|nr:hypothetical protein HUJ05_002329 [Dendroctonus ponderosae]
MDAIIFICKPSPLKLFRITRGECLKASSTTICFLSEDTTSLAKVKLCILKVMFLMLCQGITTIMNH